MGASRYDGGMKTLRSLAVLVVAFAQPSVAAVNYSAFFSRTPARAQAFQNHLDEPEPLARLFGVLAAGQDAEIRRALTALAIRLPEPELRQMITEAAEMPMAARADTTARTRSPSLPAPAAALVATLAENPAVSAGGTLYDGARREHPTAHQSFDFGGGAIGLDGSPAVSAGAVWRKPLHRSDRFGNAALELGGVLSRAANVKPLIESGFTPNGHGVLERILPDGGKDSALSYHLPEMTVLEFLGLSYVSRPLGVLSFTVGTRLAGVWDDKSYEFYRKVPGSREVHWNGGGSVNKLGRVDRVGFKLHTGTVEDHPVALIVEGTRLTVDNPRLNASKGLRVSVSVGGRR